MHAPPRPLPPFRWVYLEPIFSRGALPAEQARFKRVDDEYRDIMGKVPLLPSLSPPLS
jgi:dynein heavy chain 2